MRAADLRELVNNPAFSAVFDEYRLSLFKQWANEPTSAGREAIYNRMVASKEVEKTIRNGALADE